MQQDHYLDVFDKFPKEIYRHLVKTEEQEKNFISKDNAGKDNHDMEIASNSSSEGNDKKKK